MAGNKKKYLKPINKSILVIIVLFVLLILLQCLNICVSNISKKHENIIINFFSRQKMTAKKISLDANRKYITMLNLHEDNEFDRGTQEELKETLAFLNNSLKNDSNSFDTSINNLLSGKLHYGDHYLKINSFYKDDAVLDKLEKDWLEFKKSIVSIIDSEQSDADTVNSITLINSSIGKLIDHIDNISKTILIKYKSNTSYYFWVSFAALLLTFAILISQLYKHTIKPLLVLYGGISNLGFLNKSPSILTSAKKDNLSPIMNEINENVNKLKRLIGLIKNISQSISFEDTLQFLYSSFTDFIPYSHIGIALLKDDGKILEASYGISDPSLKGLSQKLYGIRAEVNTTSLGFIIENGIPRVINDLSSYPTDKTKSYNKILLEAGINSSITLPLKINNKPVGIIFFSSHHKNIYEEHHMSFLETLSDSIAISLNKNIFVDELLFSTILALAKMAEARDEDTGDHLERMQKYSVKIAEFLIEDKVYEDELDFAYLKDIERFSPMHDIGKVGIRDEILLKPAKLTDEEYEEMKKHALHGAEVLKIAESNMLKHNRSLFKVGIEIAEGHHEKWDGSGYPHGKSGLNIPLSARIVAVADVFDALTSVRPYKKALPFEESFRIIVEGRGKQFDPAIIDSLIRHKVELYDLYSSFIGAFDTEGN